MRGTDDQRPNMFSYISPEARIPLWRTGHRGADRVGWMFTLATAAYNLVRIRNLSYATG
jgi:hypothetical protein